ncbi:MAG: exosortase E/protease, VPEID-CTERM system [Acidobacteria bacterium]|nr:exosortase E/protease, VPEID-CTERM system [Acidobacteriota bacterium]
MSSSPRWIDLPFREVPPSGLRFCFLAVLLAVEMCAASILLDCADLSTSGGLATGIRHYGPFLVRASVLFLAASLMLGRKGPAGLSSVFRSPAAPLNYALLGAHGAAMAAFVFLSGRLFAGPSSITAVWVPYLWVLSGLAGVLAAALALLPFSFWRETVRAVGLGWIWGAAVAAAAALVRTAAMTLWASSSAITFQAVRLILQPVLPGLKANPATADIGTDRFSVTIAPECSGYEGVGLFLVFSAAWLFFFRKEYKFPAALALIPAGALLMWILNALRIATLILIGHAGAEGIAFGGFHSEAGWIGFIVTAILFCVLSRRLRLFQPASEVQAEPVLTDANPVAAYLMPFLAILAASLVARAGSADFEWLYPLRLLAAIAALWYFRRAYRGVDWRFGPLAAAAGLAVAGLWAWTTPSTARTGLPAGFVAMPAVLQAFWLACRLLAAVVTVPVAEELAFRGFLLRRLSGADFESVDWRKFAWFPFLVSSVAFGAMHESRWLAGIVAGAAYALIQIRRGRLGDAVLAHAVTNAALAGLVWYTGDWRYW